MRRARSGRVDVGSPKEATEKRKRIVRLVCLWCGQSALWHLTEQYEIAWHRPQRNFFSMDSPQTEQCTPNTSCTRHRAARTISNDHANRAIAAGDDDLDNCSVRRNFR
ncbi:hypothetical protein PBRA_008190 [Plasmodiophora brassicae]|uniref:Uncharacterized protein n=1 Tax=Plasmodiophora brassicae TaxID=37360 RepID=A0A0G4IZT6_PLABS|nr:hypothetical protein PBRA_008190 [Plasmodiophora brassicae]